MLSKPIVKSSLFSQRFIYTAYLFLLLLIFSSAMTYSKATTTDSSRVSQNGDVEGNDGATTPFNNSSTPANNVATPSDSSTTPSDVSESLTNTTLIVSDGDMTQSSAAATSSDGAATPPDKYAPPSNAVATPSGDVLTPSDKSLTPSNTIASQADYISTPSDNYMTPSSALTTQSDGAIIPYQSDKSYGTPNEVTPSDGDTTSSDNSATPQNAVVTSYGGSSIPSYYSVTLPKDVTTTSNVASTSSYHYVTSSDDVVSLSDGTTTPSDSSKIPFNTVATTSDDGLTPSDHSVILFKDVVTPSDDDSNPLDNSVSSSSTSTTSSSISMTQSDTINHGSTHSNTHILSRVPTTPKPLVINPCDTNDINLSDKPVQIDAYTNGAKCIVLVNAAHSTSISVKIDKSEISGVYTYFYIEILESFNQSCKNKYLLVSDSHTPCNFNIQGKHLKFYFQDTAIKVVIKTQNVALANCFDAATSVIAPCDVSLYCNKVQTNQIKKATWSKMGKFSRRSRHQVNVLPYDAKCTCDCPNPCICTLGYKEWLRTCTDTTGNDATKADLIVYDPQIQGVSFENSGMHIIQDNSLSGHNTLKFLNLSDNLLQELPANVCENLSGLQVLLISNNKLSNLTLDLFTGACADRLAQIDLSDNNLTTIPQDVFNSLRRLDLLDLSHNDLITLPHGVFGSLGQLNLLDLSDNDLTTLPQGVFGSLRRLHNLNLSHNDLTTLPQGVFDKLGYLIIMDMSDNDLTTLPHGVFGSLHRMDFLDLSQNELTTLPHRAFSDSLYAHLHQLHLSHNDLTTLPHGVFDTCGALDLLDLSDNDLTTLPQGVFDKLGYLKYMDMSDNDLTTLPHGVYDSLHELVWLDLSHNELTTLPQGVFGSLHMLDFLDLSHNELTTLPHRAFSDSLYAHLHQLHLSFNAFSSLPQHVFAFRSLISLNISHNSISLIAPDNTFQSHELRELDLSHNKIHNALPSGMFKNNNKLLSLDISHNSMSTLTDRFFQQLVNLKILNLKRNYLTLNNSGELFHSLRKNVIFDLSQNKMSRLSLNLFNFTNKIEDLDVSQNTLESVPKHCFFRVETLIKLNMSSNYLSYVPLFNALTLLKVLDLSENRIMELTSNVFDGCTSLQFLQLSNNNLKTVPSYLFFNLHNLSFINISHNAIRDIGFQVFSDTVTHQYVDMRNNAMRLLTSSSFKNKTNFTTIVDKYAPCCFIGEEHCLSIEPRPEYLTCNRMLPSVYLRISVWIMGLSAFVCNGVAYFVRSRKRQANKIQTLLILNLTISDLLMGVNMLMLAGGDMFYGQYFPSYADEWREGFTCKLAGFLSIFSSEGSVFFISLISIDRFLNIKYPFGNHVLTTDLTRLIVVLTWIIAFLVAAIPISLSSAERGFYSVSEVCIGIPITKPNSRTFQNKSIEYTLIDITTQMITSETQHYGLRGFILVDILDDVNLKSQATNHSIPYTIATNTGKQIGSIYSIIVFIGINLVCFGTIAFCYLSIFITVRKSTQNSARSQNERDEIRMAKKMSAIVFTDFCCWVPLCFICILTQSNVFEISPEFYALTIALILPINSSINPFLYVLYEAICDYFKQKEKEKIAREIIEMKSRWKPLVYFGLRLDEDSRIEETTV